MNTKFVLGLRRAKQVGLEHAKKYLRRCERLLKDPPPRYGFNGFFLKASLTRHVALPHLIAMIKKSLVICLLIVGYKVYFWLQS